MQSIVNTNVSEVSGDFIIYAWVELRCFSTGENEKFQVLSFSHSAMFFYKDQIKGILQ